MGKKSRAKRERRQRLAATGDVATRQRLLAQVDARQRAARIEEESERRRAAVVAADPGPDPRLPAALLARRAELLDSRGASNVELAAQEILTGVSVDSETTLDIEEKLHDLDAAVAIEALLATASADAEPDPALCALVADCPTVDRGEDSDELLGGSLLLGLQAAEEINLVVSDGDDETTRREFEHFRAAVRDALGEQALGLLAGLEQLLGESYAYPAGLLAESMLDDDEDVLLDPVLAWAEESARPLAEAVALTVRIVAVARLVAKQRAGAAV